MAGTADSLVSFVFGLEVTWDLLQVQMAEEVNATFHVAICKRRLSEHRCHSCH